jgi:predicted HicB family RNase H-like nuclease
MYADVKAELIFDNLEEIIKILKISIKKLLEFCKEKSIDP